MIPVAANTPPTPTIVPSSVPCLPDTAPRALRRAVLREVLLAPGLVRTALLLSSLSGEQGAIAVTSLSLYMWCFFFSCIFTFLMLFEYGCLSMGCFLCSFQPPPFPDFWPPRLQLGSSPQGAPPCRVCRLQKASVGSFAFLLC